MYSVYIPYIFFFKVVCTTYTVNVFNFAHKQQSKKHFIVMSATLKVA